MNKHKKGGMSQARFQRLRKGAIDHFMKEVAESAEKLFVEDHVTRIIVAGPGSAKSKIGDFLSQDLRGKIVGIVNADFDEPEMSLVHEAEEVVLNDEREISENHVKRLCEEVLKHGLAVYGPRETIESARNGQIEILLVSKGNRVGGWRCEKCGILGMGQRDACTNCGTQTPNVDLIEEIIELAERTDARIEFVDKNPILDDLGGIGGLLRFK
jgi:peptide chain release factor subunit 1